MLTRPGQPGRRPQQGREGTRLHSEVPTPVRSGETGTFRPTALAAGTAHARVPFPSEPAGSQWPLQGTEGRNYRKRRPGELESAVLGCGTFASIGVNSRHPQLDPQGHSGCPGGCAWPQDRGPSRAGNTPARLGAQPLGPQPLSFSGRPARPSAGLLLRGCSSLQAFPGCGPPRPPRPPCVWPFPEPAPGEPQPPGGRPPARLDPTVHAGSAGAHHTHVPAAHSLRCPLRCPSPTAAAGSPAGEAALLVPACWLPALVPAPPGDGHHEAPHAPRRRPALTASLFPGPAAARTLRSHGPRPQRARHRVRGTLD